MVFLTTVKGENAPSPHLLLTTRAFVIVWELSYGKKNYHLLECGWVDEVRGVGEGGVPQDVGLVLDGAARVEEGGLQ